MADNKLQVPGTKNSPLYIDGIRVTYKATTGIFNFYDKNTKEAQNLESLTGIVIGWGFQFDTQKGKPSNKKSCSLVSNEFGFEVMTNNTPIKMRENTRVGAEFTSVLSETKTYKEFKADGHRLTKIVYMLDTNDISRIYKIQFSGLSFGEINKFLIPELPNYVVTVKKSDILKSTENGDFYMPELATVGDVPDSALDTVRDKITFVYNIINGTDEAGYEDNVEVPKATIATADQVFDDIP